MLTAKNKETMQTAIGKIIGTCLGTLVISWFVMLLMGIVHDFWQAVPALGYGQTIIVYILVRLLTEQPKY